MTVLAALSGALIVAGILGLIYALTPHPVTPAKTPRIRRRRRLSKVRTVALAGLAAGALIAVVTGWLVALVIAPAAATPPVKLEWRRGHACFSNRSILWAIAATASA